MLPLVCYDRLERPEGLWTSKLSGQFVEGEISTKFYVEGKVEIKELGGHLKAHFQQIKLIVRGVQQFDKKKKKGGDDDDDVSLTESSSSEDEKDKEKTEQTVGEIGKLPKLHIFMTTKKPKKRMMDAHKTGAQIKISDVPDGVFGNDKVISNYEAAIVNVADIFAYQGIVVLKLPQDEPATEEPIIYGFIRLHSFRSVQIKTLDALHLNDLNDMLSKLTSLEEIGSVSLALSSHSKRLIKPLHYYRTLAAKTWTKSGKANDDLINFEELRKLLDLLDLFMLTVQAKRLFDAIDLKKTGKIGLIDFENYLIAKDLLHEVSKEIQLLDVYDSLKTEPMDEDLILQRLEAYAAIIEIQEADKKKQDAVASLFAETNKEKEGGDGLKSPLLSPRDGVGAGVGGSGEKKPPPPPVAEKKNKDYSKPIMIPGIPKPFYPKYSLVELVKNRREELQKANKKSKRKPLGLDYSGFLEAIQVLGYRKKMSEDEDEETMIKAAFCYGGGCKERDLDSKYLTLEEFRKAYVKVCPLEEEFKKRGLKLENSLFSDDRNRERLLRIMLDGEELYLNNLSKVVPHIENMKSEQRQKKDNRKREKQLLKDKLLHEANRFIALRAQDKRLQLKKEQEEKSKKRIEDKVLKNKLLLRQQENQMMKRLEITKANEEKEKLKYAEIKALGYDILDLSVKELREVPFHLFGNREERERLNYVNLLDLSHNFLESLPEKDFFFWLSETRKCKLSQNRLKSLPNDFSSMSKLEILELDTNRIESLPKDFGLSYKLLQRLNLSNNKLSELPLGIGQCISLKYLNIHSNHLLSLPNTLGSCFQLEYLDASNNHLRELPEDLQFLVALIHLDLNHNEISSLPQNIGNCAKLTYLDLSINQITAIPESFGSLSNLEFVNLENNSIIVSQNCYYSLRNVKSLNMKRNSIKNLSHDFGNLKNLMFLDLSINLLITLPLEIGLLKYLQTLLLSRNKLNTLPLEIGSCKSLQLLDLSYNNIIGLLPETMGIIYSLVELNISFNEINEFPESIIGFQEMKVMNAERCRLTRLPKSILELKLLVVRIILLLNFVI
jgi:leucine-rich repeat protein SHOC2